MLHLYSSTVCEFPDFLFTVSCLFKLFYSRYVAIDLLCAFSKTDVIGPALIFNFLWGLKIVLLQKTQFLLHISFPNTWICSRLFLTFYHGIHHHFFTTVWGIFLTFPTTSSKSKNIDLAFLQGNPWP